MSAPCVGCLPGGAGGGWVGTTEVCGRDAGVRWRSCLRFRRLRAPLGAMMVLERGLGRFSTTVAGVHVLLFLKCHVL